MLLKLKTPRYYQGLNFEKYPYTLEQYTNYLGYICAKYMNIYLVIFYNYVYPAIINAII